MAKIVIPIANGFYESGSLPLSAQQCVNWYPNIPQGPALSDATLFGTPGSEQLATTGEVKQANRGARTFGGAPYFVNGGSLYRLDRTVEADGVETFSVSSLGDIEGDGRVSMSDNGSQLMILVPGGKGYIFTTDPDTLQEITDPDFTANGAPQQVVFIDGYFVCTTDSKKFIISAINDGLSYNALDFGTAESDPDDIVAPIVYKNQLFIGGGTTIEAFQNIGGAGFPFLRSGLFLDKGIDSPFTIVNTSDTFMWIGSGKNESPAIWRFAGNGVEKVSTTAIDNVLHDLTPEELGEAFAWSYAQRGAYFVGFSLPSTTLVFDMVSGRWHERQSRVENERGLIETRRSRINSVVSAYGRIIVGDSRDGRIGSLDPDVFTEYGREIIRVASTQPFQNNMESFSIPSIELTVESGVGNSSAPNPQIRMDRSVDGGKTFKDERMRPIGKIGEYKRRAIWRRNGRAARFEILRFTMSDPVKPVILQLTADIV